jgi:hypothetical protein
LILALVFLDLLLTACCLSPAAHLLYDVPAPISSNNELLNEQGVIVMLYSNLLFFAGLILISLGILSTFQVTGEWILYLLLIGCGLGLFLIVLSKTKALPPWR